LAEFCLDLVFVLGFRNATDVKAIRDVCIDMNSSRSFNNQTV
jgi:hypothetical protein